MSINWFDWNKLVLASSLLLGTWAAKANLPGALDTNYTPVLDNTVNAIICTDNGKAYIGGAFTNVNGEAHSGIVRLNADGTTDASFSIGTGTGAGSTVYAMGLQSDGKLVIGGNFTQVNGVACANLARLNADGTVDTGFVGSAPSTVYSLALQTDGKILYGSGALYRLNSNGEADSGFQVNTLFGYAHGWDFQPSTVTTIVPLETGQILFQGFFSTVAGVDYFGLARVQENGSLDLTFPCLPQIVRPGELLGGPIPAIACMDRQPDGQILAGSTYAVFETWKKRLVRLSADGARDAEFTPDFPISNPESGNTMTLVRTLPGGKMLASGDFTSVGGEPRNHFVRLTAAGDIDYEFDSQAGFDQGARNLAIQPDGKYLVGGVFTTANGVLQPYLARLFGDSPSDTSPAILSSPTNLTVLVGQTAAFSTVATGYQLAYQWLHDGVPILQATNAFLKISNTLSSDIGEYCAIVSSGGVQATSVIATLSVRTIGQALNRPDLEFSSWISYLTPGGWQETGITNAWQYQTSITHDGFEAIRSMTMFRPSQSQAPYSFLQTRLHGPGRLTFYGQNSGGTLSSTVSTSGGTSAEWNSATLQPFEIAIPDGWQTVTWQSYCIDGATIILDDLRYEPDTPVFDTRGMQFTPGSSFRCALELGTTNQFYRIEWSADLKTWQPLLETTSLGSATLFEDAGASTNTCRFYRAVK